METKVGEEHFKPEIKDIEALVRTRRRFSSDAVAQARRAPTELTENMIERELQRGRRDLRDLPLVTIDSEHTRDVDDAVYVTRRGHDAYTLGVHIADVSQYIKRHSPVDREALKRGTSVYFPDKVLPMLPREFSNGICSLNVGADRLALSVEMTVSEDGVIIDHDIYESIICVKYKISYDKLHDMFEGHKQQRIKLKEEFAEYYDDISLMKRLAEKLHAKRRERGAIDFETIETEILVDENGAPTDVRERRATFAERIIEEFMVAANETVAEHFYWLDIPFIYRNHEPPKPERVEELAMAVKPLGYVLKGRGDEIHSSAIQAMLDSCRGKRIEPIMSVLALRSMQKAEYSGRNRGHFGLASECYTHFTSPIRRYPDLYIHRVIKSVLHHRLSEELENDLREELYEVTKQCSQTEREAEQCERLQNDIKVAEFMADYIGDEFSGVVCGVTRFGVFVRLDNSAQGLVFYNSMNDYMVYDEKRMCARGEHSGRVIAMGDTLKVIIVDVKVDLGQIEMRLR